MEVAVLMSTYNGAKFLEKQIESILNQKGCSVHLFVRDDGSTDTTVEILKEYHSRGKIEWYQGENLKPAKSFLHLLFNCGRFPYYSFSDQDDIWDEDKLINGIKILEKTDTPAIYYCNSRLIDQDDNSMSCLTFAHALPQIIQKNNFLYEIFFGGAMGCTMVMNDALVSIFRKGSFPEKILLHDSYIQGLCISIGGLIFFDGVPHMDYRQHSNNAVGRKKGVWNGLKSRMHYLTEKREVFRSDYAKEYLEIYGAYIPSKNVDFLNKVANYRNSFQNRVKMAISRELKFNRISESIFNRFLLLMGKK